MAQNYICSDDRLDVVTPAGGFVSGTPFQVGVIIGVALNTSAQGETNTLMLEGAFSGLPKASGQVWGQGVKLFWDNTAKNFTTTSTNNTAAGYAYAAAASGDTTGSVILAQIA